MKFIYQRYFIVLFLFSTVISYAQVGINTTSPDESAALDISSTESGLLITRMRETDRLAIANPATGLLVYQADNDEGFWFYNGTAWQMLGGGNGWELEGNTGTNPAKNAIGTSDNEDFVLRTNGNEVARVQGVTGNVGVGTTNPQSPLHLVDPLNAPLGIQDGGQMDRRVLVSDANGDAVWEDAPTIAVNDEDWIFNSGNTTSDPIYHEGPVTIGIPSPTTHTLLLDSGDPALSQIRLGSVEIIQAEINAMSEPTLSFDADFFPNTTFNASISLGSLNNRWSSFWVTNGIIQMSDRREKEQIENLELGLKEVLKLQPVSFEWKEEKLGNFIVPNDQKRTHLGFIAQEVQEVIPEMVETFIWKEQEENPGVIVKEEGNVIGLNYSEMIPVLVKAIQEQEEVLKELEQQNEKLKKALAKH